MLKVIKKEDGYWLHIDGEKQALINLGNNEDDIIGAALDEAVKDSVKVNEYDFELSDERVAKCFRGDIVEYKNAIFEAGKVGNIPPETHYLRVEKDGDLQMFFMRKDELLAIHLVIASTLFGFEVLEKGAAEQGGI